MKRLVIGLAICLGFGAYGTWNAVRWANWPKAPLDMTVDAAIHHPDAPWVRLTNGDWRCDFAYTEGTFSYFTLTDGRNVVLVGYEDKPQCPPQERPAGAFREINSNLLDTLQHLGFRREAVAPAGGGASTPVYVLFTHEGPGNFIITVPLLFAIALIGLAYALTGRR